jgi:hypothetical protein
MRSVPHDAVILTRRPFLVNKSELLSFITDNKIVTGTHLPATVNSVSSVNMVCLFGKHSFVLETCHHFA